MKKYYEVESICVFVANLPSSLSDLDLTDRLKVLLSVYGLIVNVKTSRDSKGRPFAFVQYQGPVVDFFLTETVTLEDRVLRFERAKNAIIQQQPSPSEYQPTFINNDFFTPPQHRPHQSFQPYFAPPIPCQQVSDVMSIEEGLSASVNKIFVGHLNGELVTQRKLLRRFQHHGHITDIELFKKNIDGSLRKEAFAFISYLTEEQQLLAIKQENDQEWLGRRLKCCKALPKRPSRAVADDELIDSAVSSGEYHNLSGSMNMASMYYYPLQSQSEQPPYYHPSLYPVYPNDGNYFY